MFSVLYSERGNFAVLNIPKCGSQALMSTELASIRLDQYREIEDRLAFVRHPVERLQSAFRFFMGYRELLPLHVSDYESFVDYTFEVADPHWQPMTEFIFPYGECVVKEIHPLHSMSEVLEGRLGYKLPFYNKSDSIYRVSNYRLDEILVKYQNDLELYNGIC